MTTEPRLYAVVGATGTGKSEFALDLVAALRARGANAEIVGADAMQLYRGMDIGTAKLPVTERRGVPHHLLDVLDPRDDATVAWYQDAARAAVQDVLRRGRSAVLVGGSGLYVSSVLYDFRFPPRDASARALLEAQLEQHGAGALYDRLRAVDPVTADRVDPRNGRRIVRALEIAQQGATGHGAALPQQPTHWLDHRAFFLEVDRAQLVGRLDERVQQMWRDGLLDEVRALQAAGLEHGSTAPRAIGYAQALAQLAGTMTHDEAVAETQALTRRYARRQVSWFRRYAEAERVDPRIQRPAHVL